MPWTAADAARHKKGLSPKQQRQWAAVANSARAKCIKDGGSPASCDASAIRQANGVVGNAKYELHRITVNQYSIRTTMHQGRKHLIVPVIMMVEGVHNGSRGPILHTSEELGRCIEAWNGIPVTVQHPADEDGTLISANAPGMIDAVKVGRIYNAYIEDGKLKAEAWIDEGKIKEVSPMAYNYIQKKKKLDVSVGVFSDEEESDGVWHDEEYSAIAHNHRPDHLALLPGGKGACSWADGCGVRVNEEGGIDVSKIDKAAKELRGSGFLFVYSSLEDFEQGLRDTMQKIQDKLNGMDNENTIHFLQEVYDNYFIYEVRKSTTNGSPTSTLYKRNYSVDESKNLVDFADELTEVRRKVDYVPINTQSEFFRRKDKKVMANEKTPCCPEKVKLLIQSVNTPYQEADREFLESLDEGQIDKIVTMDQAIEADEDPKKEKPLTMKEVKKFLEDRTFEEYLNAAPAAYRDMLNDQQAEYDSRRTELVQDVVKFYGFTEDQLKEKPISELKLLAAKIPNTDYSARNGDRLQANQNIPVLMPNIYSYSAKSTEKGDDK